MSLEEELADNIEDLETSIQPVVQHKQKTFTTVQIKSYIAILTSALGGIDHASDIQPPPYKLGDEALLCLQDIKKWLKTYDDKEHSYHVAIACAESGLINDLITILCLWDENSTKKTTISGYSKDHDTKIARLCLQVLVILTWPIHLEEGMYTEQLENYSNIKKYQVIYKKQILTYRNGAVLRALIKLALPIIGTESVKRTPSDYGILRLSVTFFRNLLVIEPAAIKKTTKASTKQREVGDGLPRNVDIEDVSIGACITAFDQNMVFTFLLTMCSSLNDEVDLRFLSSTFIEILNYLIRSLRPHYIMLTETTSTEETSGSGLDLGNLLSKEKDMKNKFQKNSSSRHGRFGTLLSLQTPDMGRLTVSGGGNITDKQNPIKAFDAHKAWHKPQRFLYTPGEEVMFPEVAIGAAGRKSFHTFVCDFIDGALNPFMDACVHQFTSDDMQRSTDEKVFYLYIISWFLEAQRIRIRSDKETDYRLIGSVLSEMNFRLITKLLREANQAKEWGLAHAGLIALKEVIYIVDSMSESEDGEIKDVATNVKERLFHKNETVDIVQELPKLAHKRSPEFVNTCVDIVDVLLKVLEDYSNENLYDVIMDKKANAGLRNNTLEQLEIDDVNIRDFTEVEAKALELSEKRKSDFKKLQSTFINHETVNTYIVFLERYIDLSQKELKKAIKYLHRVFFINQRHNLLYRLDFLYLVHEMLSDEGLPRSSSARKHLSKFLSHYMKKLRKNLETNPSLYVELLFPPIKAKDLSYFLDTGEVLQEKPKKITYVTKVVELKNVDTFDLTMKVAVLVASLIDDDKKDIVEWLSEELEFVSLSRMQSIKLDVPGEAIEQTVTSHLPSIVLDSEDARFKKSLVIEPKVRLILELADFKLPESTIEDCVFSSLGDLGKLNETITAIKIYLNTPVEFENNRVAKDFIKIRQIRSNGDSADEDDEFYAREYSDDDDDIAFEVQGQKQTEGFNDDLLDNLEEAIEIGDSLKKGVARSKNKPKQHKERDSGSGSSRRKARHRRRDGVELAMHDVSDTEEATKKNQEKQHERYISSKYIVDSDDESDEEADRAFFEKERALRELLKQNDGLLSISQLNGFLKGDITSGRPVANKEDAVNVVPDTVADIRAPEATNFDSDSEDEVELINNDLDSDASDSDVSTKLNRKRRIISGDEDSELDSDDAKSDEDGDVTALTRESSKSDVDEEEVVKDTVKDTADEDDESPIKRRKIKIVFDDDDED